MTGLGEILLFAAGVVLLGLVFLLAILISARHAEAKLARTMTAASAIVSKGLASIDDDDAPDEMLAELARLLDGDSSVIAIPTGDGRLGCGASYGYPEPERAFIKVTEGMSGRAFTTGKPVVASDVTTDPDYVPTVAGILSAVAVPLKVSGRIIGALDIESRKRRYSERDLAILAPLADQVGSLIHNRELNRQEDERRASEEMARAEIDRLKDDFLATVSHELRTPLTSMKGSAQTVLARGDDLSEDERRGLLEAVVRQCDRLSTMVETLLLVSRLETDVIPGRTNYVLLRDLVNNAIEAAGGRGRVERDIGGPPGIVTDQFRAHHVIRNLVENACKYAPKDSPVLVRTSGSEDEVLIEVLDQGPGVSRGDEEAVFERFRRGADEDRAPVPGTGLGLYIAKRFVTELGGEIDVRRGTEPPWTGAWFSVLIRSQSPSPLG